MFNYVIFIFVNFNYLLFIYYKRKFVSGLSRTLIKLGTVKRLFPEKGM